jgi:hypothetical protein
VSTNDASSPCRAPTFALGSVCTHPRAITLVLTRPRRILTTILPGSPVRDLAAALCALGVIAAKLLRVPATSSALAAAPRRGCGLRSTQLYFKSTEGRGFATTKTV